MGVVIGLLFGTGALLVWSAFVLPAQPSGPRRDGRMAELLAGAGMSNVQPRAFLMLCAGCALVVGLAMQVVSRTPTVAVAFGAAGGYLPIALVRNRSRRRQREFAEVWPEAVDNLVSAVRAGMSLPDALAALAVRGPEPLREAFAGFALDYQVTGRFGESLDRLKATLADPVGDRVVEGLRVAREVGGGDLSRLLRGLANFLRDDARTRGELRSRQAWAVNGARLGVAAPWLVLLLLSFQREVIHRYSSPTGALILLAGALLCVVAYRAMLWLGRLPVEKRILS